jgi:hypothetical protein
MTLDQDDKIRLERLVVSAESIADSLAKLVELLESRSVPKDRKLRVRRRQPTEEGS